MARVTKNDRLKKIEEQIKKLEQRKKDIEQKFYMDIGKYFCENLNIESEDHAKELINKIKETLNK